MIYNHTPEFVETAWQIGCTLIKNSIWHEDRKCNWTGYWIEPVNGEYVPAMRTFGPDLYAGTAGIALFLAALYTERNDAILLRTIEGALQQVGDTMHTAPDHGFYCGKPGIAAVLISVGHMLDRSEYVSDGIRLLETIRIGKIESYQTDLISGIAGSIPLLLDVHALYPNQLLIKKAVDMGRLLCDMAVKDNGQWSWVTVPSVKNLTGYSHGASGIASALLRLYIITGEKEFLEGSVNGVNYEQSFFDTRNQNWPDFREAGEGQADCAHAWCHGAPGIALSRMQADTAIPNAGYKSQADTAMLTTATNMDMLLRNHFSTCNYSLCHGLAGNADVLLESGNAHFINIANAVGLAGISNYARTGAGWPSGLSHYQYPTPGLMMGLAGTGYFYLRLHDSKKFKSVLMPGLFSSR